MLHLTILDQNNNEIKSPYNFFENSMALPVYYLNRGLDMSDIVKFVDQSSLPLILPAARGLLNKIRQLPVEQHFAGCIVNLLEQYNHTWKNQARVIDLAKKIGLVKAAQFNRKEWLDAALPNFMMFFSVHPALIVGDANHRIFNELNTLVNSEGYDTSKSSFYYRVMELIHQFKFPGIKEFRLASDETLTQQRLDVIDFPLTHIPEEYTCDLTGQLMLNPIVTNGLTVDFTQFIRACETNDKDKYVNIYDKLTFELADMGDTLIIQELKQDILLFVEKAEFLAKQFPSSRIRKYDEFKVLLTNNALSLATFKAEVGSGEVILSAGFLSHQPKVETMSKSEYEHCIRQMAAKGDSGALEYLLTNEWFKAKEIDINAVGSQGVKGNPPSLKTALHQVVIGANKYTHKEDQYRRCYQLLIEQGASEDCQDRQGKTAAEYDDSGIFQESLMSMNFER